MDSSVDNSKSSTDLFGLVAVVAAVALAMLLACRPVVNADMGYHLRFGQEIWETHHIPDNVNDLIYSAQGDNLEPGPGQWIGSDGKMHFVCSNWGTQILIWPVWKYFGPDGLIVLKMLLVGIIFTLIALLNHRLGVPRWFSAAVLVILALAGYERFNIRPELFSYILILCQFHILLRIFTNTTAELPFKAIAAMTAVQLAMITFHSFFPLTWFFIGLLLAQTLIQAGWTRLRKNTRLSKKYFKLTGRLLILLVATIAVCFVNPWTWRMVAMPFELFIKTQFGSAADNPYLRIGEIASPFLPGAWNQTITLKVYIIALCITAVGGIAGAFQRRWAMLALICIMFSQTIAMRRNIFLGSILMLPAASGCLWFFVNQYLPRARDKAVAQNIVKVSLSCLMATASFFVGAHVIDNSIYFHDRRNLSFGSGISQLSIPIGPAEWINENKPLGRIWTDFDSSSNALFFIQPSPKLPALTNTWATPMASLIETLNTGSGKVPWDEIQLKYLPEIVLIKTGQANSPLLSQLVASKFWTPVFIDAQYAVFLKADGLNARLAGRSKIRPSEIKIDDVVENIKKYNDTTPLALQSQAVTFQRFGWVNQAIELSEMVVRKYPDYHEAWFELGASHCLRGSIEKQQGRFDEALKDFKTGKKYFQKCLELQPGYYQASYNIGLANADINEMTLLVE